MPRSPATAAFRGWIEETESIKEMEYWVSDSEAITPTLQFFLGHYENKDPIHS